MIANGSSVAKALTSGSYMGGVALGAATLTSESLTGVSPLDFMPSPFTAPLWGTMMGPITAMRTLNPISGGFGAVFEGFSGIEKTGFTLLDSGAPLQHAKLRQSVTGASKITSKFEKGWKTIEDLKYQKHYKGARYSGPLGFKTLMLGMGDSAGLASKLSIGNMALSTAELVGHAFAGKGMGDALWVKSLQNARSLGIAGMLNIGEEFGSPDKLAAEWAYKFGGIDPAKVTKGKDISVKIAGGGKVTKYLPEFGDDALKAGVRLGTGLGARAFSTVAAGFSLYTYLDIISTVSSAVGTTAAQGIGQLAATLNQWVEEKRGLEFGYGRIPQAMISSAAATERKRAVQATYGAKINPRNRLMGNEASYHHSR